MTDELKGKILKEVVCLRSTLFSIDYLGGTKQSAKGVQKSVKKSLHHSLFKNCLLSKSSVQKATTQIKSVGRQIVVNSPQLFWRQAVYLGWYCVLSSI